MTSFELMMWRAASRASARSPAKGTTSQPGRPFDPRCCRNLWVPGLESEFGVDSSAPWYPFRSWFGDGTILTAKLMKPGEPDGVLSVILSARFMGLRRWNVVRGTTKAC